MDLFVPLTTFVLRVFIICCFSSSSARSSSSKCCFACCSKELCSRNSEIRLNKHHWTSSFVPCLLSWPNTSRGGGGKFPPSQLRGTNFGRNRDRRPLPSPFILCFFNGLKNKTASCDIKNPERLTQYTPFYDMIKDSR